MKAISINRLLFPIVIALFLFSGLCNAQSNQDFEQWSSAQFKLKVNSNLTFSLEQGLRFNNNISTTSSTYSEIRGDFDITKFLNTGFAYRFTQNNNFFNATNLDNRYVINLKIEHKISLSGKSVDNISLSLRSRFQSKYRNVFSSDNGRISKNYIRNKLEIELGTTTPAKFFSGFELFYLMTYYEKTIDAYRVYVGGSWSFDNGSKIEGEFIREIPVISTSPVVRNIISISYSYKLKLKSNSGGRI